MEVKNIEELLICYIDEFDDYTYCSIPRKQINNFIYDIEKQGNSCMWCKSIFLEINFKYIDTHDSYWYDENKYPEEFVATLDKKAKDIEKIIIKYANGKNTELIVPFHSKHRYINRKKYDAYIRSTPNENLYVQTKIKDNKFIIEWKQIEEKSTYMNPNEINEFFSQKKLTTIFNKNGCLGMEIVNRILNLKSIDIIGSLYRNDDEGYETLEVESGAYGYKAIKMEIGKCSCLCNYYFILVPKLNNKEDEKSLEKLLYLLDSGKDEKNFLSMRIILFNDDIDMEKFMKKYFRNSYGNKKENEPILLVKYSEFNKIWYDIHKEWKLL